MYNLLLKIYLFIFLAGCHLLGWGQETNYFRFQKIEGLSQNTVFKISQDSQGFLWAGTGDGLNRYDGIGFKVYEPSSFNADGYITGRIIRTRMIEDESERIWLSTETGLQYLDKKTDRFHFLVPFGDSLNYMDGSLYPIGQVEDKFWFGKTSSGLLSFNLKNKQYQLFPFPGAASNPLTFLGEKGVYDQEGNIWTAQQNGLFCFNIYTHKWQVFYSKRKLSHLCLVNKTLYIVSPEGIEIFDIHRHTSRLLKYFQPGIHISCLAKDGQNRVWAGDANGNILRVNQGENSLSVMGNINGSNKAVFPVYDLYFDASDILWIGTDGMGLLKAEIHPPDFDQFPSGQAKENIFIKSIYEAGDSTIWLGTFGYGILKLNKNRSVTPLKLAPFNQVSNAANLVEFMQEDQFKNVWIGYGNRLYCRKYPSGTIKEIPIPVINQNRLRVTGMTPFNNDWIITTTLGVFHLSINKSFKKIELKADPTLGNFSFMVPLANNNYIFGYHEGGLFLLTRQNGSWLVKKQLVKKMGFKCAYVDSARHLLWFGTDNGLMAFNPLTETYQLYTEEDGLSNGFVYGIIPSQNELWLSTNGGICQVKLTSSAGSDFPVIACRNFKQQDGLQADEFNTGAFLKASDGTLYFGGINGVNWFTPGAIHPDKKINQLAITGFTVNNLPADTNLAAGYTRRIQLAYNQNNLYLQFRALEFSNPEKIHYFYKLSGWDKDWVDSKNNTEVRYNNLPPANYTFYVKASNNGEATSTYPYAIHISIRAPFWNRWWFYLLTLLVIAGILIWITKIAAQRKLKKKIEILGRQQALFAERMRISREMHDDIGAGLTQITLMSESVKLQLPREHIFKAELEDISSTSRQLVDNISEIIWALNPQHATLEMLLVHLREQIYKLVEYAAIGCQLNFPDTLPAIELNNQQRRNILLITKEIVHNAIKYSQGKNIQVTVIYQKNHLVFDVCDDGIGFDPAQAIHGNGMRNIQQRVQEIGGSISMQSAPGNGTRYLYSFALC